MTGEFRNENASPVYMQDDFLNAAGNSIVSSVEITGDYFTPGNGAFETSTDWTSGWTR